MRVELPKLLSSDGASAGQVHKHHLGSVQGQEGLRVALRILGSRLEVTGATTSRSALIACSSAVVLGWLFVVFTR